MKTPLIIASVLLLQAMIAFAFPIPNGDYVFECDKSDKVLTVEGDSKLPNANIVILKDANKASQKFTVTNDNYPQTDFFTLTNLNSKLLVTATGTTPGSPLNQQAAASAANKDKQLFELHKTHDNYFQIINKASGLLVRCDGTQMSKYNNRLAILGKKTCEIGTKFTISKITSGPPKPQLAAVGLEGADVADADFPEIEDIEGVLESTDESRRL